MILNEQYVDIRTGDFNVKIGKEVGSLFNLYNKF